ncbi:ATP-binding cassette, subfamily F, uup [Paenibacillus sp. UNCCL117]|uniref:ABC-F family ATP-binding cassette domain-containing protein n=1 Tax=unclassified Paenibacillus TaxID=185978 RepID=UPI00088E691E|nr:MULTISPECIES: ABC-F family ATP-binding cassette domain-containing protein [unclassified Paenibacillus]SDC49139.1 ATP-binding cassette, subfamily F, uup [Paenibacillus sp. cl123]SFW11811.1 ATP-binding cassette, subfamily F, uup [Paenibacillus sp. UNCCL117]
MNIISVEDLYKSYGEKVLFDGIAFQINERERIGLVGVNGTGKSTLLRVMAGLESTERGKLTHANHFHVEYLPQQPEFDMDSTVLEQVFHGDTPLMKALRDYEEALALLQLAPSDEKRQAKLFAAQSRMDATGAWEAQTTAKTVLSKLGIRDFSQRVGTLSGGQRKRVAMARVLIQPADLLILDEPTNHIDHETVEWLEGYLSSWKGSLLLVTHDRYFLDRVTNRMFELDRGKLYSYEGNYASFLEKKAERMEREASMEDKRQNLLRRELAWLRRGAKARTTKQKARIDRVTELRDRKVDGPAASMDMSLGASRLGKKIMELEDVGKSYGDRKLIGGFSYIVLPEDRIGIIGPNGSGKSTLLHMLAGRLQPDEGTIETGTTVKLAYYTQENVEMDDKQRAIDYIKEAAEVIRTASGEAVTAGQMLERFLFTPSQQWTPIGKLSGGERRRLYLLRTLMGEPNVLLLDEPTNDLDIQTLTILEEYLDDFPGVVITVSHDRYFLDRTADHLFVFEGDGQVRKFYGNYSEYLEQSKLERQQESEAARPVKASAAAAGESQTAGQQEGKRDTGRPKKLSFKEQKEWDGIEDRIAEMEDKLAQVKRSIEQAGSDYGKVQDLFREEQELTAQLEQAMERWSELSELVESIGNNK